MYILRVCKSYGYSKDQLNNLFNSLIMSVFLCEVEAWGAAYQRKFLDKIDRFLKRAHRFGFTTKKTAILDLIKNRDSELFKNVTVMIIYFMICYLQRGDVCSVSTSMTLYYLEL